MEGIWFVTDPVPQNLTFRLVPTPPDRLDQGSQLGRLLPIGLKKRSFERSVPNYKMECPILQPRVLVWSFHSVNY